MFVGRKKDVEVFFFALSLTWIFFLLLHPQAKRVILRDSGRPSAFFFLRRWSRRLFSLLDTVPIARPASSLPVVVGF